MSHENDSFIDEVTEEVRRERLFATLKKYGWIGILGVLLIVGGASWNEYRKASAQSAAEQRGDEIMAALQLEDATARAEALNGIEAEGDMAAVIGLLSASEISQTGELAATADVLEPLAGSTELAAVYSDLAAFKYLLLGDETVSPDLRSQLLDRLSQPGAPFRNLALEQQALDLAAAGETDAAIEAARALLDEPALSQALVRRVSQLIVALGADIAEEAG